MIIQIPDDWTVWHCEELSEIDCPWVDTDTKKYAECLRIPCWLLGKCSPVVWEAKEIKVYADQALVLINPLPDDDKVVEEPKISELTI